MENLFIPYELAVIAKEKGFDEPCICFYSSSANANDNEFYKLWTPKVLDKNENVNVVEFKDLSNAHSCLAPTYLQLVDWFDDKHKIRVIFSTAKTSGKHRFDIIQFIEDKWVGDCNSTSFYDRIDMRNKAIEEAFKLI